MESILWVINFTKEPFVCTDEIVAWKYCHSGTLHKVLLVESSKTKTADIAAIHGRTADIPGRLC